MYTLYYIPNNSSYNYTIIMKRQYLLELLDIKYIML